MMGTSQRDNILQEGPIYYLRNMASLPKEYYAVLLNRCLLFYKSNNGVHADNKVEFMVEMDKVTSITKIKKEYENDMLIWFSSHQNQSINFGFKIEDHLEMEKWYKYLYVSSNLEVPDNLLPGEQKQFNLQIERLRKVPTSINIDTDQSYMEIAEVQASLEKAPPRPPKNDEYVPMATPRQLATSAFPFPPSDKSQTLRPDLRKQKALIPPKSPFVKKSWTLDNRTTSLSFEEKAPIRPPKSKHLFKSHSTSEEKPPLGLIKFPQCFNVEAKNREQSENILYDQSRRGNLLIRKRDDDHWNFAVSVMEVNGKFRHFKLRQHKTGKFTVHLDEAHPELTSWDDVILLFKNRGKGKYVPINFVEMNPYENNDNDYERQIEVGPGSNQSSTKSR